MKSKHYIYIILIAISTAVITGCKKEAEPVPERPIPEYKLPDDFLRYFAFKPGSYWVYKNSKNGMLDTVTVTKYLFGYHTLINATNGKALYKYESFDGEMHSSAYPADYFIHSEPNGPSIDKNKLDANYDLTLDSDGPWGGEAGDRINFFPMTVGDKYDIQLSKKIIFEKKDSSLYINSKLYDSVQVFYVGYSAMFYMAPVRLYYKRNIGMIRRANIDNGDDWEMIDYKTYY